MTKRTEQSTTDLKKKLERVEEGDLESARQIDKADQAAPENKEAAEQEASDGPEGRGLAR